MGNDIKYLEEQVKETKFSINQKRIRIKRKNEKKQYASLLCFAGRRRNNINDNTLVPKMKKLSPINSIKIQT